MKIYTPTNTYSIEFTEHAMIVRGKVPASDMEGLAEIGGDDRTPFAAGAELDVHQLLGVACVGGRHSRPPLRPDLVEALVDHGGELTGSPAASPSGR